MDGINLMSLFKVVTLIFTIAAIFTGLHAIINPTSFATSFGIPLPAKHRKPTAPPAPTHDSAAASYVALLGARQLGTGITLLVFAIRGKWIECATILSIIGVVVAGMDGWHIARSGDFGKGVFHAGPGLLIAALAGAVVYSG
jgi:hypothetical protein